MTLPISLLDEALAAAEAHLDEARGSVAARVQAGGRTDPALLERDQFAAHGFAWTATYVAGLREMLGWARRLEALDRLTELDRLVLQAAFGEYLAQLAGGIAISQGEVVRPADLGLNGAALRVPAVERVAAEGNSNAVRMAIAAHLADGQRPSDGLDDESLALVRSQFRRFADERIIGPAHGWHSRDELIPMAVVGDMADMGVFGLTVPEEWGGLGMGKVAMCVVTEELSRGYIAVRLELDRSTVYRIRRKATAGAAVAALQVTADAVEPAAFPDPEMPPAERWPVTQFIRRTGAALGVGDARHLADVARCYEAEGRADELVDVIGRSASAEVRDPWAYLQRCITNRGDAWTVTPQLLGDVLTWGGEKALEYSLLAIGGGQVRRPLPYLRRVVATAVGEGRGKVLVIDRPVAMAVAMSARLAPELQVVGADDAVAAEDADVRTRHVESYRRRRGRLPWEDQEEGSKCCIGLKEPGTTLT